MADPDLSAVFAEEWGRVVATLIGVTGDWDLAEEAAAEAVARALAAWPRDGAPRSPGAWLTTAARNHAFNVLRRRRAEAGKLRELAATPVRTDNPDERLALMFTCCHPALPMEGRVALTLRTLTGMSTADIAAAFLVGEPALAQRIVRAKRKITEAGIPYRVPPEHLMPERLPAVLAVLYLLFNEGYSASCGPGPLRPDLTGEAVHLARMLARLMPDEPEVLGLLALMLLHDSRRDARVDARGRLVSLEDQDRSRWRAGDIAEGLALVETALRRRSPGPYQIQAAIAACHAGPATAAGTDWAQIAALYGVLEGMAPSPVVALNRAVAVAMAEGPEAGLALLGELDGDERLGGYHLLPATRADLLRRLGRDREAADAYRRALGLAATRADREFLRARLSEVDPPQ
ncbi:DUF6596 domain-containing protein [Phytomonospora sp. NPDC050363]|uniref:RNA polymerase sigma factor n=1 Tax=Phytomonospora sp. NPDC050363 TaxID=3155642 RepID=UPI0033D30AB8